MNENEWMELARALKGCVNSEGTLHYSYDARLDQILGKYAPDNLGTFDDPQDPRYRCKDRAEVEAAIDGWVKVQRELERTVLITHAQLELERYDDEVKTEIMPRLGEEGKLLVRGVVTVEDVRNFPDWRDPRPEQAKALFNVGARAIEVFQQKPTALVLFPNLIVPDSRVFGGFYGSPWSTFNNRSLRMKFRNLNRHFQIHVCTVWERQGILMSDARKVGVLFTYVKPVVIGAAELA